VTERGGATGADLDLVLAEIHAEADRLRASHHGTLDAELDASFQRHVPPDLDGADSAQAFAQLDALTAVSIPAPDTAPRPGRAEWKRTLLRAVSMVVRAEPVTRLIRMATSEITAFNAAIVRTLRGIDGRVTALEARVGVPTTALRAAADLAVPPPASAELVATVVAAVEVPDGRVLHAGCARGELVRALTDVGIGAYGVDRRRSLHVEALRDGLDVRGDDPAAHLAALPDASVGAIVLDGTLDTRPVDEQLSMLDDARRATVSGGRLIVVLSERTGPAAVAADLSGGRALLPATWHHLMSLRTSSVRSLDVAGVHVIVGNIEP